MSLYRFGAILLVALVPSFLAAQSTTQSIEGLISRSEEHTSELQSQSNLVCRLLLEKKKQTRADHVIHHATSGFTPLGPTLGSCQSAVTQTDFIAEPCGQTCEKLSLSI